MSSYSILVALIICQRTIEKNDSSLWLKANLTISKRILPENFLYLTWNLSCCSLYFLALYRYYDGDRKDKFNVKGTHTYTHPNIKQYADVTFRQKKFDNTVIILLQLILFFFELYRKTIFMVKHHECIWGSLQFSIETILVGD